MAWQDGLYQQISRALPAPASVSPHGSVLTPALLDGWSDLDLHVHTPETVELTALIGTQTIWAFDSAITNGSQVLRMVFIDGRRLDLTIGAGGRVASPVPAADNNIRFTAAIAAAKLGRGDQLIGLHLTLDLLRRCLEQAMLLRDRDTGTTVHRHGSARDALASTIARLARRPLTIDPRPNVVELAVDLYGAWRREGDPSYSPDWSGLEAVITRGLGGSLAGNGRRQNGNYSA
jgi:hypothetical protein